MRTCYNQATTLRSANLAQTLKYVEEAGFEFIELWISSFGEYFASHSVRDLRNFFAANQIKPFAFDSFEEVNFRTGKSYYDLLYEFERACNLAAEIDCKNIVLVPSIQPGLSKKYSDQDAFDDSVAVLSRLGEIARGYNVRAAFEPIGFADCAVRTMQQGWEIVQAVNLENVGLTLDVFNIYLGSQLKDLDVIEQMDPNKIFVFHINDAPIMDPRAYKLDHSDRVLPGDGALPVQEMIATLKKAGYQDAASVEIFNREVDAMDPREAIHVAYKKTNQFLR